MPHLPVFFLVCLLTISSLLLQFLFTATMMAEAMKHARVLPLALGCFFYIALPPLIAGWDAEVPPVAGQVFAAARPIKKGKKCLSPHSLCILFDSPSEVESVKPVLINLWTMRGFGYGRFPFYATTVTSDFCAFRFSSSGRCLERRCNSTFPRHCRGKQNRSSSNTAAAPSTEQLAS